MGWRLYADDERRRTRQAVGDALAVVVVFVVVRAARRLGAAIGELRSIAAGLDRSGRDVEQGASRAIDAVDGIPAVGGALASPFRTVADAGSELTAAGAQVGGLVDALAFWIPAALAVVILAVLLAAYAPSRWRWIREASEVDRLLDGPDAAQLLAVRAAAGRPLRTLRRAVGDPAVALAEERWTDLAGVELDALGLSRSRLGAGRP